jgi:hypothetical protein
MTQVRALRTIFGPKEEQVTGDWKRIRIIGGCVIHAPEQILFVAFFLLGDSSEAEFYEPTFQNTRSVQSS